jgi:hypothetical protein
MTYAELKALFGAPEAPGRLQVLGEILNTLPPPRIDVNRQGFLDQLGTVMRIYEARSGTVATLQARSSQVSFKALYQAVSELQEEVGDRCPACDTPLVGDVRTVSNPYTKAAEGLRELRELGSQPELLLRPLARDLQHRKRRVKQMIRGCGKSGGIDTCDTHDSRRSRISSTSRR